MLIDVLIVAAAAAFFVSAAERFRDLGLLRGILALVLAIVGVILLDYPWQESVLLAPAGAFLTLFMLLAAERTATQPPMVLDRRSRREQV